MAKVTGEAIAYVFDDWHRFGRFACDQRRQGMKGKIHLGTSGWHYKHWIGTFYPEGTKGESQLEYYLKYFKTVEINNSFYRVPQASTFENWRNAVPEDFLFSVKANRFFTHLKKLKVERADLERFIEKVG